LGDRITGLKLLLDPDQPRPYYIPTNIPAELAKLPKSTLEVATDYLRALYEHAMAEVAGEYLDGDFLDNYQKQFVLTVPAVWSDKAKDMTLRVILCWENQLIHANAYYYRPPVLPAFRQWT
jgi:hypothetical protein